VIPRVPLLFLLVLLVGCGRDDAPDVEPDPAAGAGTAALTAPAPGQGAVHIVRLLARGDQYAFEPAEVRIRPGDVVRFVQTDHQPEAVAFDAAAAPAAGAEYLARKGLIRGPLLTEPGVFFDVPFVDVPPGEYPFHSVPHGRQGMQGRVVVEP
jgi:plastocyanin